MARAASYGGAQAGYSAQKAEGGRPPVVGGHAKKAGSKKKDLPHMRKGDAGRFGEQEVNHRPKQNTFDAFKPKTPSDATGQRRGVNHHPQVNSGRNGPALPANFDGGHGGYGRAPLTPNFDYGAAAAPTARRGRPPRSAPPAAALLGPRSAHARVPRQAGRRRARRLSTSSRPSSIAGADCALSHTHTTHRDQRVAAG
jgi:hypothetical protein